MKNFFVKKIIPILSTIFLTTSLISCSSNKNNNLQNSKKEKLVIAYQYGMAYAPFVVMKEQNLIEKYYPNVDIEWQVLNSGSAINEAMISGKIDVAAIGAPPFITGVSKDIPYKMFTGLSGQPNGLITNNPNLNSLSDFTSDNKIALVNFGCVQHLLLAMASEKEFGDPHALDNNITAMALPDATQSLLSGGIETHFASAPYLYKELESEKNHEIKIVDNIWPKDNVLFVGVASNNLYENNKELYDALVKASNESIDYINNNKDKASELLCENEGVTSEVMLSYLNNEKCIYTNKASGIMDLAEFMYRANFIDKKPSSIDNFVYDNLL